MDRPLTVLHVEDCAGDRRLTAVTFEEAGLTAQLFQVECAEDALAFLRGEGDYAGSPRPDLILLDLGLPGMSGGQLLDEIRRDDALRSIPVVVQTGSDDDATLVRTLGQGAHDVVAKPLGPEKLSALVEYVTEFA